MLESSLGSATDRNCRHRTWVGSARSTSWQQSIVPLMLRHRLAAAAVSRIAAAWASLVAAPNDRLMAVSVATASEHHLAQPLQRCHRPQWRLQTECGRSGLAAQRQPPPEPAFCRPARRPTAAPLAAATQQRWARRGAERLLSAKAIGPSRPPGDTHRADSTSAKRSSLSVTQDRRAKAVPLGAGMRARYQLDESVCASMLSASCRQTTQLC